jgi:uncharacterized protein YkwD
MDEARLCLTAGDCEQHQICGPSGECADSPAFLESTGIDRPLSDDERELMSMWDKWGTVGTQSGKATTEAGHAFCTAADVRQSDLAGGYSRQYPDGYWGAEPVDEANGRCGDDLETLAWRLLNCERMSYGLEPLSCDQRLVWMGRQHADDMQVRSFFDHVNPDSRDPFERMDGRGIEFEMAGENLARFESVEAAHEAWMNSDVHRRTLLTPQFTHGGIGIIRAAGQLLIAQELTRVQPSTSRSRLNL